MKKITEGGIAKFNAGKEAGLKEIFDILHKDMFAYSVAITHDCHESEDILQKVFTKFWQMRGQIESDSHARAMLFTMVKNSSIGYIRSVCRRIRKISANEEPTFDWLIEPAEKMKPDMAEELHAQIEQLPATCKRVLKLQLEGWTTAEICDIIGIKQATVYNHHLYAVNKLRKIFNT